MEQHERDNEWRYARQALSWYGWGSAVGFGIGFGSLLISIGLFLKLLHEAGLIR